MDSFQILPGKPLEPGTFVSSEGVNFSVFSRNGTAVFLDLFGSAGDAQPFQSISLDPLVNRTGDLWHVFVTGLKPGALYLYRVAGPSKSDSGHRFNEKRYLFDPCAKAFTDDSVFAHLLPDSEFCPTEFMPKCVIVDSDSYDWEGDRPLSTPLQKSIIYEAHVKGFTASASSHVVHPGTFRGMCEKIDYLKSLGVTAVELLPVQEFDEFENTNVNPRTGERMKNFWGYSTIGFYAPKTSYASDKTPGGAVREFKDMVKAMHRAGIEVILDVVFNHTAEGNEHGITLNFRGFDNSIYYLLVDSHKEYYVNFSGCGNTVNCNHPVMRDFIINCLRYWVTEMHVDGFRFDLASVLCRSQQGQLLRFPPLPNQIAEDPVLRNAKIIAEPWDCAGAYQVGSFPGGRWSEWNDHYRDAIRRFIRGDEFTSTEAATRLAGSSDLYSSAGRSPLASVNYIDSHDGFTINDLVSYNSKHNDENGEENRDGTVNNNSYNYGYEGPSANPRIERMRTRQIKNFFACLLLSQGVPMFVAGDEVRRSQNGNNNAYCQDNECSWFDWNLVKKNNVLLDFVRKLIMIRRTHPVVQRTCFFGGDGTAGSLTVSDISWFNYDGTVPDWAKLSRFLACRLGGGRGIAGVDADNDFYIAINTDIHDMTVILPPCSPGRSWFRAVDTSIEDGSAALESGNEEALRSQERYVLIANSVIVLISK
jgi:isoamylase